MSYNVESDESLRALAIKLLTEANMIPATDQYVTKDATERDIDLLAEDLAKVEYDSRLDKYVRNPTVENIFLSRIGGVYALQRYLPVIRSNRKREQC